MRLDARGLHDLLPFLDFGFDDGREFLRRVADGLEAVAKQQRFYFRCVYDVDAVIVQAFHQSYRDLEWSRFRGLKVVFDGRGAIDPERIRQLGVTYLAVGWPGTRD